MARARTLAAGALLVSMGLPAGASAAITPQEATFSLKYASDFSYERNGVVTPKAGCGAERGTQSSGSRSTIAASMQVKIQRRNSGGGIEFLFFPVRSRGLAAPFPVTLTMVRTESQMMDRTAPNDVETEDRFGDNRTCTQGAFTPFPDNHSRTSTCRYKGNLFLLEERGKVQAAFVQQGRLPKCADSSNDTGYPNLTNFFPMRAKTTQAKLYGKRTNVLTATGSKFPKPETRPGSGGTLVTTEKAKAKWTMTLTRTSAWRAIGG